MHRGWWRQGMRIVALLAGPTLGSALPLHAQSIRVRAVETETGRPIAGALLVLESVRGTPVRTLRSDGRGQALFAGFPPGAYVIRAEVMGRRTVFSPVLGAGAGSRLERLLSLPLLAVTWGSVEGTVWDSTLATPLAGATVILSGTRRSTRSDARGRFRIAGVAEGRYEVRMSHPRIDSLGVELAAVPVDVAPGATGRAELAIPSLETLWAMGAPLDARLEARAAEAKAYARVGGETSRQQMIRGRILDADVARPVSMAEVVLSDQDGARVASALSGDDGTFRLPVPAAGWYTLRAEALGYEVSAAGSVEVGEGQVVDVEVRLETRALALDSLVVTVERRSLALDRRGFYDRMKVEPGTFFTPERLERRAAERTSQLFQTIPGAVTVEIGLGRMGVYFRGTERPSGGGFTVCWPRVIVDGLPVSQGGSEQADLDHLVDPWQIEGMEVYRRPSQVPAEYGGAQSGCGVIVIWTKR